MSRFDLVIFGATGFTGKHAVGETARLAKKYGVESWAIAGRSREKLDKMLLEISEKTGEDLSAVKVIIADVGDEASLKAMCHQARVVVNCCGPYRLYGEPVVRAAIAEKAHYVDVSGEPQFLESMQLRHDSAAREAGVYVVGACGLDSIPNDMGVIFLQQQFGGTLNSVESYISIDLPAEYRWKAFWGGAINYGTWESLVYSIQHMKELVSLRKQLYPQRLPAFQPRLNARSLIHKKNSGWCLPFPGADASVVYRTQRHLHETAQQRPAQFKPYVRMHGLATALLTMFVATVLFVMSKWSVTRQLLLDYPRVFSLGLVAREGPPDEVATNTTFQVQLHGEGWPAGADVAAAKPNKKMVAKVSGVNPGYGATVTALVLSAVTILRERDSMPGAGGVLTTGVAFAKTKLIKNLNENNVKFEIIDTK